MRKAIKLWLLLFFILFFGCFCPCYSETQNAILISWDGAQRSHLVELIDANKVPGIKSLKDAGAFVEIKIEGHETCTSVGHAQMLTGLTSEIMNVYNNQNYKPIPKGYTI